MKTNDLIHALDNLGTRNVLKAYKYAFKGAGKPESIPEDFWEKIKIWKNFSDTTNTDDLIKSDYELDSEIATKRIDNAKKGDKKKYLDDAMKLANKHADKSNDAKSDTVSLKDKLKNIGSSADIKYNEEKKKLAEKYIKDNSTNFTNNGENKMEISQKDLKKIMKAMNTINKHFAEEVEEKEDEVVESEENDEMTTVELPTEVADAVKEALDNNDVDEDESEDEEVEVEEDEEVVEEEDADSDSDEEEDEEMTTIELPTEIAEAVKAALECEDGECDEEDEEEMEDEDEEEHFSHNHRHCPECNETVRITKNGKCPYCGEYLDSDKEMFSMKEFYKFSETVTETIENLNKKVNKLAKEVQEAADEKTIEFSEKDFYKFAESVTETIEGIAKKVECLECDVKKEVTKDLSKLKESYNDADKFVSTIKEEKKVEQIVKPESVIVNDDEMVIDNEQFSKRYANIKNFLTL